MKKLFLNDEHISSIIDIDLFLFDDKIVVASVGARAEMIFWDLNIQGKFFSLIYLYIKIINNWSRF